MTATATALKRRPIRRPPTKRPLIQRLRPTPPKKLQLRKSQLTPPAADAAAAANAGKTPEQLAAEKEAADKAAADAAKNVVPDKYELKLPDNAGVNTAIVEKTAAIARELGLSQDNAQKTLTFVAQEAAAEVAVQLAAWEPPSDTNKEGGAKWREQEEGWRAASLADPDLGNGKPEQLQANVTLASKVVGKFGDKDLAGFFEKSGLGSNPATLRFLSKIGKAMSEGSLVISDRAVVKDDSEEAKANRIYDHPTSRKK
jgi:hypothetical protein